MISSKALVSPAKYRSISSTSGSGLRAAIGIEASNVRSMCNVHSPPLRGGVDAPSEAKAQRGWSDRRNVSVELTTPARQLLLSCRATPPLRGGEYLSLDHSSPLSLDIVGSTWFKELYIRDYGGFRLNKVGCSEPPEAPSPPVPWPDCRRFQLRFADEPVSSCNSAGHGLCGGQPQRVRHEGKTCLLRPGGHWT